MSRLVIWLLAGAAGVALTVLAFCPAAWMSSIVERQTAGRFTLGDAQGTLWRGSAFIGGAPGKSEPVTPLLPGRFAWRLSPAVLLGRVDAQLENPVALSDTLRITGSWAQWQVSPAAIVLPAERLSGLGAPLNTIQLSGHLRLSWGSLQLLREGEKIGVNGSMALEIEDLSSRLSPIKPLGAYKLTMDWRGQDADMKLDTVKGPMLLSGAGGRSNGHWQFGGRAEAQAGHERELANMLNLLGESRREGDKIVIALEFK